MVFCRVQSYGGLVSVLRVCGEIVINKDTRQRKRKQLGPGDHYHQDAETSGGPEWLGALIFIA